MLSNNLMGFPRMIPALRVPARNAKRHFKKAKTEDA